MTVDLDAMMRDLRRIGPAATPDAIAATFALCAQPQRERGSAPYISRDVAAAVAWTRTHIAGHGGDPTRIVLMGHSAGATHIASFLAGHGGQAADQIAAAVLLSAIYDAPEAARHEHDPRMLDSFHAYF